MTVETDASLPDASEGGPTRITVRPVPLQDTLTISDYVGNSSPDQLQGDEPSVEGAQRRRYASRRVQAAEQILNDLSPEEPEPAAAEAPPSPAVKPAAPASAAGSIARDIGRGLIEAPRQIVGGARDAAQAAIDLGDWIADKVEEIAPLGGVQLFNDAGEFKPEYIPAGDPRLAADKTGVTLPKVKDARTVTGGVVRSVSQFLTGFVTAGGAIGATAKSAPAARAAIQGGLANFVAFQPDQQRLSDLVESVPALRNPVTDYLGSSPDDGQAEGRFKHALEGLALGVMAEGLFKAVRYIRDARRAATDTTAEAAARAEAAPRQAQPMNLLGDDSHPLLLRAAKDAPSAEEIAALSRTGAAPLTEGDRAIFVNFSKIESPDDVKRVIATTTEAFKEDINAARRGVRSNETTLAAADKADGWKVLMERRGGAPLNAEQSVAARRLWEASAAKLLEIADVAAASPSAENLFQFRRMMAIHNTVQSEAIAARTETARALQSWKIPVGAGGAERLRSIENILATNGGPETAAQLAREVAALRHVPDGMAALADVVEKGVMARGIEVAKEIWINALLSNPKTHIVNTLGNFGGMALEMVERSAAGMYSQAIGSGAVKPGEAAAKAFALRQGVREGLRLFWKALKTGESSFGVETTKVADAGITKAISADALKINPDDWMGRAVDALGSVVNLPTRFLGAEDDFFKAIAYRMEVNAVAFRHASQEVTDGKIAPEAFKSRMADLIANPPEHVRLSAIDYSAYQTYTSLPGNLVQGINRLERRWMQGAAGEQISSLVLRLLIPFRNTPANLVKYAFERTPLAPLMNRYREAIARGGADADIARARMSLGTMATLSLIDFALDGTITGGGPRGDSNKGNRDTLLRSGWQPYSIKIGDRYFSYRRSDPFGLHMGTAADIAELISNANIDEDKKESILSATGMLSASFGNLILDKTYMSTVSSTIDILHNPDRAPAFFSQRLAAFLPAVGGETRRQIDPYIRWSSGFVDELKNRTPGLSESLPIARDMWGRPRTFQSGLGTVYDALSPIASRLHNPEPIDREAIKNDFNMGMPNWTLAYGKTVSLPLRNRAEGYSRFLEIRGQERPSDWGELSDRMKALREKIGDGDYHDVFKKEKVVQKYLTPAELIYLKYGDRPLLATLNDIVQGRNGALSEKYAAAGAGRSGGKDEMITKIVADYGRAAKAKLLEEFSEGADVVARKREKRESTR